nr:hypothetical protein [Tanacetum cinerariifolium]
MQSMFEEYRQREQAANLRIEELSTIPEKKSDEFIKYSVENLIPIPSESEDTSECDSEFILPSDDKSLSDEDVLEDNVKIYSNPLFEFDDEYISSDVNPLFDEVLEDIECKDSYDSNLDESTFLVTPLSDVNKDEYFTPGDGVELLLHRDPSTPIMSVVSILEGFTDEPPLEENDDLFDLESKENEWKKIFMMPKLMISLSVLSLCEEARLFLSRVLCFVIYVQDCPDFEDSRARGFVHRPFEILSLAYGNSIS